MRDVIIEQPPYQTIDWNVWGVVQQEIAESNSNSKYFAAFFAEHLWATASTTYPFVRWVNLSPKMLLSTWFFLFPLNILELIMWITCM